MMTSISAIGSRFGSLTATATVGPRTEDPPPVTPVPVPAPPVDTPPDGTRGTRWDLTV